MLFDFDDQNKFNVHFFHLTEFTLPPPHPSVKEMDPRGAISYDQITVFLITFGSGKQWQLINYWDDCHLELIPRPKMASMKIEIIISVRGYSALGVCKALREGRGRAMLLFGTRGTSVNSATCLRAVCTPRPRHAGASASSHGPPMSQLRGVLKGLHGACTCTPN